MKREAWVVWFAASRFWEIWLRVCRIRGSSMRRMVGSVWVGFRSLLACWGLVSDHNGRDVMVH